MSSATGFVQCILIVFSFYNSPEQDENPLSVCQKIYASSTGQSLRNIVLR